MTKHSVIVIGGGLAGLTAAATAAQRSKEVLLIARGTGMIDIGSGTIDILGYLEGGRPQANPSSALAALPVEHPYAKIGVSGVAKAMEFFLSLCAAEGYEYVGSLHRTQWVPTVAGTLKPSCLVPKTMDTKDIKQYEVLTVAGFNGLKDFYPHLIKNGLQKYPDYNKTYQFLNIETGMKNGRDLTALDVARWLDTQEGQNSFVRQVGKEVHAGAFILIPPVLGTAPDYRVMEALEARTGCRFVELAGLPPAVTGLRLKKMLINYCKKSRVKIIEHAVVNKAVTEQNRCMAVVTENSDRMRTYSADAFVLATGGFLGKGLTAGAGRAWEPIFQIPVKVPVNQEEWSNFQLFSSQSHNFAKFGLAVDNRLRPVDENGQVILQNVYIAGKNLSGYDYCFEKSGNGVAIASGYLAGMSM